MKQMHNKARKKRKWLSLLMAAVMVMVTSVLGALLVVTEPTLAGPLNATIIDVTHGRVVINNTGFTQYVDDTTTVYATGSNANHEYRLTGTLVLALPHTLSCVLVSPGSGTVANPIHLYLDNLTATANNPDPDPVRETNDSDVGSAMDVSEANVTITLMNGTNNVLTCHGFAVRGDKYTQGGALVKNNSVGGHRLTIRCESADVPGHMCAAGTCGALSAIGTANPDSMHIAAIGSSTFGMQNNKAGFANLYITGGIITTKAAEHTPGIGTICGVAHMRDGKANFPDPQGTSGQLCTNINITGGRVFAYGGNCCAGIGSGWGGPVDGIYISDGAYVYAEGGKNSPGIGSGGDNNTTWSDALNVSNIVISGGSTVVEAVGSNSTDVPGFASVIPGIGSGLHYDPLDCHWGTVTNVQAQPETDWYAMIKQGTSQASAAYTNDTPSPENQNIATTQFYNLVYFSRRPTKTASVNGAPNDKGTAAVPVPVAKGDTVKYSITTYVGDADLAATYSITDEIPAGMTLKTQGGEGVAYTPGMSSSTSGGVTTVEWTGLSGSQTVFFTVTVDNLTTASMDYINQAEKHYVNNTIFPTNETYHRAEEPDDGDPKHKVIQENILQSRNTGISITENFPDKSVTPNANRTKEVSFENTGTSAVFLRVAISERWETGTLAVLPRGAMSELWETAGEIILGADMPAWSIHADWEYSDPASGGDGWYYYKKVLPKDAATANIISSVTFPAICPANAEYQLDFLVEVVQASNEDAVNRAATLMVFGREGWISSGLTTVSGAVTGGNVTWN